MSSSALKFAVTSAISDMPRRIAQAPSLDISCIFPGVMREERKAQLRYARALLQRGRYGEILKRAAAAVRTEVERLLGRSDEAAYRRWIAEREQDLGPRLPAEPT